MRTTTRYSCILLALLTLVSIFLGCWKIGHPGLYYDEMLFGNAAIGGKSDNFVRLRIGGVPVLLMDYIGALKAWIYYPVFYLFSVNYWSVRLPAILIGTAGSLALVAALWRGFGRSAAIAGAVLILLDPTLITHSRLDWGPNALMFLFRGLMILSAVEWIKTRRLKWAWLGLAAAALGIFDKLNFIWIASAGVGSLLLVYPGALRTFVRTRQGLLLAGVAIAGLGIAIARGVKLSEHQSIDWAHRLGYALTLLRYTFSGGGALNFISGDGLRLEQWILPGYGLAALGSLTGWRTLGQNADDKRLYIWIWVFTGMLGAAFILTKSATGPHHSSVLSGIWQLTLAPLLGASWDRQGSRLRRIAIPAALTVALSGSIIANLVCIRAFERPVNYNWDPANTRAAFFAREHPEARFVSTDWGIGTQVIALTDDHPGIMDAWPEFVKAENAVNFFRHFARDKDTYIYTRLPGFENFKGNRENLSLALDSNHIGHDVVMRYSNWKGEPMIEIWKVPAAAK